LVGGNAWSSGYAPRARASEGTDEGPHQPSTGRGRNCFFSRTRLWLPIAHQRRTSSCERARSNRRLNGDRPQAGGALAGALALKKTVTHWLNYYSGSIKAAFVIACVLGAALIGLAGLSLVPGILIATSCAAGIVGVLAWLQGWINAKNLHTPPIRVVNHPELGQVSVYRNGWRSQLQPFGLPYTCTLTGAGEIGVPTQEQVSLWRAVCDRHQSLLEAGYQALSTQKSSASSPVRAKDCRLSLIQLQTFDTFMFFLAWPLRSDSKPGGFFVRYKAMTVIEAGRTPWKATRAKLEG